MVAKQRGSVDIAARDFGMHGEDFLCAIERAVPEWSKYSNSPRIRNLR
jgi:hypothetical protein